MTAWVNTVRYIANGEAVDATNTNRMTLDVAQRTQYLKEIVDQITAGELLVIRDAVLLPGVAVGDWVYYDATTEQYKRALSEVLPTVGGMITGPRSFVVGVVVDMTSPILGLIVTGGLFRDTGGIFSALDPGAYFLSEVTPGLATNVLPVVPVAVPIFLAMKNANNTIQISIDTKDLINSGDATYSFAVTSIATVNTNLVLTGCEDGQLVPPGPLDPRTKDITIELPDFTVTPNLTEDGQVLKDTDGGVGFLRGYVVQNIIAGAGINLSATHTGPNGKQGDVTISSALVDASAVVSVVSLDNAREESIRGVLHHSFPADLLSSMRLKIKVPGIPGSGNKTVSVKLWVTGTVAALVPDLAAAYHVLVAPNALIVGPIPSGDTALADVTMQLIDAPLKYFDAEVEDIVVPAGSIIHISLTRNGQSDLYLGDIGILYMTADIT
jgi:hypothetical protein